MYQTGFLLLFTKKDVSAVRTKIRAIDFGVLNKSVISKHMWYLLRKHKMHQIKDRVYYENVTTQTLKDRSVSIQLKNWIIKFWIIKLLHDQKMLKFFQ